MAERETIRGLAGPITRFPGGYFSASDALETAWGDLMNIIFTRISSRPMARGFGSGLHDILFEPDTENNEAAIEELIRGAVDTWLPSVNIVEIATFDGEEEGTIVIEIAFTLIQDQQSDTRAISISRDGTFRQVSTQALK